MTENDSVLLEQFTRDESQDAFSELVHRHLNLVYSAAFRQLERDHTVGISSEKEPGKPAKLQFFSSA